jgi:hypothetical protein
MIPLKQMRNFKSAYDYYMICQENLGEAHLFYCDLWKFKLICLYGVISKCRTHKLGEFWWLVERSGVMVNEHKHAFHEPVIVAFTQPKPLYFKFTQIL